MDSVDISEFGGVGDGVTDTAGALDKAVATAYCRGIRTVTFGVGRFMFNTPPDVIKSGIHITGANRPETMLVRNYSPNPTKTRLSFLEWRGGMKANISHIYGGTGGGIHDLHIVTANGCVGGVGLFVGASSNASSSEPQPDGNMFVAENIEIYADDGAYGYWDYSLYVDGSHQSPPQIRDVLISRCDVMNGRIAGIFLTNVVACYLRDVGVYGGLNCLADLYVHGEQNADGHDSRLVNIHGACVNGTLHLENCRLVVASGIFGGTPWVTGFGASDCIVNGTRISF